MTYEYELDGIHVESDLPIDQWGYGTVLTVAHVLREEDPVMKYLAPLCDTIIKLE